MPIAGASFAAGAYLITWNGSSLGIFMGDQQGPTIDFDPQIQRIDSTSSYGASLVGGIYLGRQCTFRGILLEFKAATLAALFPFGPDMGDVGDLGTDMYDKAQALVLTAVAGSLAAASGPLTLTANKACRGPNPTSMLFGPPQRVMPLSMELMQFTSAGRQKNFTFT